MAPQRPTHVPRFGNWDANDHAPYTKVFETARAGRGGKIINPNDPSQNPEAFAASVAKPPHPPPPPRQQDDQAPPPPRRARADRNSREDGDYRKYMESPARKIGSQSPSVGRTASNNTMNRSPLHPAAPSKAEKGPPALPKFGDWDARDPSSGEGFTMIFNNARNERQINGGPGRIPQMNSNLGNQHEDQKFQNLNTSKRRNSWFCCFS